MFIYVMLVKALRKRKAKRLIGIKVCSAKSINVEDIARQSGVPAAVVHIICERYVRIKRLQRLRNTPGIDYYPIGHYGSYIRFPHADGTKNPFLARLDNTMEKGDIDEDK